MFALALAAIALQSATPQAPENVPPPCSHVWTIPFDSESAALSPRAEAILDNFTAPHARWGPTTRIVVVGHTDTIGGTGANLALSHRRAEAVAAYLIRRRIRPSPIEIVATGEHDLIEATPDETASASNRVARIVEQVPSEEKAGRRTAWSAFPSIVC
jgi:OOP family OmpA-OmpF porin